MFLWNTAQHLVQVVVRAVPKELIWRSLLKIKTELCKKKVSIYAYPVSVFQKNKFQRWKYRNGTEAIPNGA